MFRYWLTCHTDDVFAEESQIGRLAAFLVLKGRVPGIRVHIHAEYVNKKFLDWNDSLSYNKPIEEEEFTWR